MNHEQKVLRLAKQLRERKSTTPVSLKKKAVSHQVPDTKDKRCSDEKIDISDFDKILYIDRENQVCVAEPGVTFVDLVTATIKHNLVPIVVPELKTITVGGAVAGCSIESMSYKKGGFHDNCLEYEIVTAKGEVLKCTPDNENKLLFHMIHGTFGTLGIITKLKFKLIPAKPYVKVTYKKYYTLEDYKAAIWKHYENKDVDFMDGIIHSPKEYVLSAANFVDTAPYTHNYDWTRVYFKSTKQRKEDYLKTPDYFFRYDKGITTASPKSFLGRLFFRKFMNSTNTLKMVEKLRWLIPERKIPITVDTFIPFTKVTEFMKWYNKEINYYPLWCVPYKLVRNYDWISDEFFKKTKDKLYLDLAIYGMKKTKDKNHYKILEDKLMQIGALKTLISTNYYTETDFWKIWNKKNYDQIKQKTDPNNIFRDLYTKMCKTKRGIGN